MTSLALGPGARWGISVWGEDRWPAVSVADLCQQPPLSGRGVPIGVGDWRVVVEMLLPADASSLWGIATWGESEWTTLAWADITGDVRGAEWTRGADEVYGRARAGQLTLELSSEADQYDPWNPTPPNGAVAYLAPGTLVRIGVISATDTRARGWLPQITAVVDEWPVVYVGPNKADRYCRVTAFETVSQLARIDDNALPGLVGGGESTVDRITRLLDAAGWRYGLLVEAQQLIVLDYPVQSTDMAANRLAECYLTADSADAYFRSDRTGAALLTNVEYAGNVGPLDPTIVPLVEFSTGANLGLFYARSTTVGGVEYVPYSTESFRSTNSADAIVNDCRFARVGGTQQVFEQLASIERYGRSTLVRNDFIVTSDAVVQQIAQYTTIRRALNSLRVDNVTVDVTDIDDATGALCVLAVDVGNSATVFPPKPLTPPESPVIQGFVRGLTHRFTPRSPGAVTWQTDISVDTRTVYYLPGAQLPATPA